MEEVSERRERPKRNVRRARSESPEPAPTSTSKRRRTYINKKPQDAPALRCQGMTITEIDLLKFVWALQTRGFEKLDAVGVELGYKRGAAAKILGGLANRIRRQDEARTRDVFSVTLFPTYYDQIIQVMRDEHCAKAGTAAAVTSNAWSQAMELAGKYGRFPEPQACEGVDYRKICRYLASALRGVPPPTLDPESDKALKRAVRQMQDSARVQASNRVTMADWIGQKLSAWKEKVGEKNAKFRPKLSNPDEVKVVPGRTEPEFGRKVGEKETEEGEEEVGKENGDVFAVAEATLDEKIQFAIENSPCLNPLGLPSELSF